MLRQFIEEITTQLTSAGYTTESSVKIPGIQALLYARSSKPFRLGFAKVEDHFLFLDWGNDVFGRLDLLRKAHRDFSKFVNLGFRIPRSLRMHIPNLAVIAVSNVEFPADVIRFTQTTYLNPWEGGETGQFMLIDLEKKEVTCHNPPGRRQTGAFPLSHAVEIIEGICKLTLN